VTKQKRFYFSKERERANAILHNSYKPFRFGEHERKPSLEVRQIYDGKVVGNKQNGDLIVHYAKGHPVVIVRTHEKKLNIGDSVKFEVYGFDNTVVLANLV